MRNNGHEIWKYRLLSLSILVEIHIYPSAGYRDLILGILGFGLESKAVIDIINFGGVGI